MQTPSYPSGVGVDPLYFKDTTREDIELAKDFGIVEFAEIDSMRRLCLVTYFRVRCALCESLTRPIA